MQYLPRNIETTVRNWVDSLAHFGIFCLLFTQGPSWSGAGLSKIYPEWWLWSGNFSDVWTQFQCLLYYFLLFLHYDCLVSSQAMQNIKSLLYVSSTVEKYKSPLGTRDNPATSCKDLMYSDNYQDGGWGVPFFGSTNCFRSVWKLTIWRRQSSLNWVGSYLTVTLYEMVGFQNFKLFSSGLV